MHRVTTTIVSMTIAITGTTAAEIADSIRELVNDGVLVPGDPLPPVRDLATTLGVNRNTANAAYRRLADVGLTTGRGRAGTVIAAAPRSPRDATLDEALIDLGSGNPAPEYIPTATATASPVLYGAEPIDDGLRALAQSSLFVDFTHPQRELAVTNGAVDAIERILAARVGRDELVAIEAPGLLTTIDTARIGGFRTIELALDAEGPLPASLAAALEAGAKAVVLTPRAQNPTGASVTAARSVALQAALVAYPDVLVIEDDHFALLSNEPYCSAIASDRNRFALIRSVSAALGPDSSVALVAGDPTTVNQLRHRQGPGSIWVSHILQRLVQAQLENPRAQDLLAAAGTHYLERAASFAEAINDLGITGLRAHSGHGLHSWVTLPTSSRAVVERLAEHGWRVRDGADFWVTPHTQNHIRVTAHALTPTQQQEFVTDLASAIEKPGRPQVQG